MAEYQDTRDFKIDKRAHVKARAAHGGEVDRARAEGKSVETVRRHATGKNTQKSTAVSMAKLEGEEEDFHLDRVDLELRKRIQQARMAKKMTQAELAKLINEKPQVVNEYESGKAVPNPSVLGKMERILGVKLRGKIDGKKKK